jgi:hypothetical protein
VRSRGRRERRHWIDLLALVAINMIFAIEILTGPQKTRSQTPEEPRMQWPRRRRRRGACTASCLLRERLLKRVCGDYNKTTVVLKPDARRHSLLELVDGTQERQEDERGTKNVRNLLT